MKLVALPRKATPFLGQLAQDLGLAALVGGNLFGRLAMHPALADISDETQRGKVLNHAWRRYGNVNSAALVALVAGWITVRGDAGGGPWTSGARRRLILGNDIAVGAVVVTGLASAVGGVSCAQQAPDGAVPLATGSDPAPDTPARAAALKRIANLLGGLNLVAEVALAGVNALLARSSADRRL